jgi:hypothetical protein
MANEPALKMPRTARRERVSDNKTTKSKAEPDETRQRDTAQYVADMILELRNMAKSAHLFQVMVPLEYAYYEAFSVANRVATPEAEVERLHQLTKAGELLDAVPEEY